MTQIVIFNDNTALTAQEPIANPTFTGTVVWIPHATVDLASADKTSDLDKSIKHIDSVGSSSNGKRNRCRKNVDWTWKR